DGLIIAALFGQIVAGSIAINSVKHAGVGQHASYLQETNPETITTFFKYMVALSTWYATTEGLAKIAVCLLYNQLFPQRSIHITMYITISVLICASISGGLVGLFSCSPFSAHWGTAAEQATHCINREALFIWGSFPNIFTDVVILVVPIPVVWKLQASTGVEVGLIISFLFGSIGLITSILRFGAFYKKSSFLDPTYDGVELGIWTVCELGVYLIAACLIVFRPILDKLGFSTVTGNATRGKTNVISKGSARRIPIAPGESGGTRGLGLTTISSNGFSQFNDGDEGLLRENAGINTATDIELTWEARYV
ncbi:hypothetical protein LSUB1_G002430, partial [Lachnellula subtilissima]